MIALERRGDVLRVATSDPFNAVTLRVLQIVAGDDVELVVAEPERIAAALDRAFPAAGDPELPPGLDARPARAASARRAARRNRADLAERARVGAARAGAHRRPARRRSSSSPARCRSRTSRARSPTSYSVPVLDVATVRARLRRRSRSSRAVARRHRFVPLAISDHVLFLAMADPLDDEASHDFALDEAADADRRHAAAPRSTGCCSARIRAATSASRPPICSTAQPDESAYRVLTCAAEESASSVIAVAARALARVSIRSRRSSCFNVFSVVFYSAFSLYKFKLIYDALGARARAAGHRRGGRRARRARPAGLHDPRAAVPRGRRVVPRLIGSHRPARLPEDEARREAARRGGRRRDDRGDARRCTCRRTSSSSIVPDAQPKTKPKACNYGLLQAEGKYVVIYDAEDRPDPDQLKKVVVAFAKAERRGSSASSASSTTTTATRTCSPAGSRSSTRAGSTCCCPASTPRTRRSRSAARPTTSCTEKLVELGAWDPFNVTEDADLGIRLHKAGYKTAIIDSTTLRGGELRPRQLDPPALALGQGLHPDLARAHAPPDQAVAADRAARAGSRSR